MILRANHFSVSFGLCGLAQAWSTGHSLSGVPAWPSWCLWALAALVWIATLVTYVRNIITTGRLHTELRDATYAPFLALALIVPMMGAGAVHAEHGRIAEAVFILSVTLSVMLGAWLTAGWLLGDAGLTSWHPGYLLPTVAAGFIAAGVAASMGHDQMATMWFGYGLISWLLLFPVIFVRLIGREPFPSALTPTLAILVAPPVVGGGAWFAMNGNRSDVVGLLLAGYAVTMIALQLRLVPVFARTSFGPGTWAFSFSYAAACTWGIKWLHAADATNELVWTYATLAPITCGIVWLFTKTAARLVRGTYLGTERKQV